MYLLVVFLPYGLHVCPYAAEGRSLPRISVVLVIQFLGSLQVSVLKVFPVWRPVALQKGVPADLVLML